MSGGIFKPSALRRAIIRSFALALATGAVEARAASWWESAREAFRQASESDEVHASIYYSPVLDTGNIDLHYLGLHYRHLWNFADGETPNPWSFFVGGHVETPFKGPGDYMIGGFFGLRWEKPLADSVRVFYVQGSFGALVNDIHSDDPQQKTVGYWLEFRENITIGLRNPLGAASFDGLYLELSFEHISNASLDSRNGGVNALGAAIGMHY